MKSFTITAIAACIASVIAMPAAPIPAVDGNYMTTVLKHHNVHRANHSSVPITWGPAMAMWAHELASRCSFAHNTSIGTKPYGQNIAAGTAPFDISYVITNEFYNGEVNWFDGQYGKVNPDFTNFEHYGHFSQVVWNGSTHVGCATVDCSATGIDGLQGMNIAPWMTVCNYFPAGNMGGEWADNVFESKNEPTVYGNY